MRNVKKNLVETLMDGKWAAQHKKEVVPKLVVNGCRVLDAYRKEHSGILKDELDDYYETLIWLRSLYTLDRESFKQVKQKIYDLLVEHKRTALMRVG